MPAPAAPDSLTALANKAELIELALKKASCLKKPRRPDKAAEYYERCLKLGKTG